MSKKSSGKKNGKIQNNPNANLVPQFFQEKKPMVRFLVTFVVLVIGFYIFYNSSFYERNFQDTVLNTQANVSASVLRLLGYPIKVFEDRLSFQEFMIRIKGGCDGMEATALFLLAILAFPIPFKYKIQGIFAGIIVLVILNVLRIVGLFMIGVHYNQSFEFFHLHGGVVLFTIASIALWLVWVNWSFNQLQKTT